MESTAGEASLGGKVVEPEMPRGHPPGGELRQRCLVRAGLMNTGKTSGEPGLEGGG